MKTKNIGAPPKGWNMEQEKYITQQITLRKHRAHSTEWHHRPNSHTRFNLISRPKPDSIDETKSGNRIYRLRESVPVISFPEKGAGSIWATLYKISGFKEDGETKKGKLKDRKVERKKEE